MRLKQSSSVNKSNVNDDILNIVKGFIDYLEAVDEGQVQEEIDEGGAK